MKNMEKNMMCVLLLRLLDKNLITPRVFENAREQILGTHGGGGFFCDAEKDEKGESNEYTQDPC